MMKHTSVLSALLVGASVTVATTAAKPAAAITFGFQNIFPATGTELSGDGLVSNFSFDVSDLGGSKVRFLFSNNVPVGETAAIKQVAFSFDKNEIPPLLANAVANASNVGTVNFDVTPSNLSQSNKVTGWIAEVEGGDTFRGNNNSVQRGEKLSFDFTGDYNNVIAALNDRSLIVGIHVGSIGLQGNSDSFVHYSEPVPEPITMLGLGVGTVGLGVLKRKYGKKEAKAKVSV